MIIGLRKKEIQLKTLIEFSHQSIDVEDEFRNFYNSKFYHILSKIDKEQDILKIENIDSFIAEYESYIEHLNFIKKVILFVLYLLNFVTFLILENRK